VVEQARDHGPAVVDGAQDVVGRDQDVVEEFLAELLGPVDVLDLVDADAGLMDLDDQHAQAPVLGHVPVGPAHAHRVIRLPGEGLLVLRRQAPAAVLRRVAQAGEAAVPQASLDGLGPDYLVRLILGVPHERVGLAERLEVARDPGPGPGSERVQILTDLRMGHDLIPLPLRGSRGARQQAESWQIRHPAS
jgi:hypothetical protein